MPEPRRITLFRALLFGAVMATMYFLASTARLRALFSPSAPRTCRKLSTSGKIPSHYKLPSGDRIPTVALGVWQASPGEVGPAVQAALKAGYRHIDGAWIYRNEEEVGKAIRASGVSRPDVWLTSKLWNSFHAPEDVEPALDDTLTKLGVDYLDLYLMHWPIAFKKDAKGIVVDQGLTADPYPTWKAMEELVRNGKVRNIGVSNFNTRRLQNLTANNLRYVPAVNQVELNFWNPQPALVQWAKENHIRLEAYSPLGSTNQVGASLRVPEVKKIAEELCITPAQVILSWQAQRGAIILPKSVHASRIEENMHLFELPEDLFDTLEKAAAAHPPQRVVNPSKSWGVDVFEDET